MKALLKTGKIIDIIPNDELNAAKYVDKETSEYVFDDEIAEILADETWDREQMLKDAVEGEIAKDNRGNNVLRVGLLNNGFEIGDKVRIIIVKED